MLRRLVSNKPEYSGKFILSHLVIGQTYDIDKNGSFIDDNGGSRTAGAFIWDTDSILPVVPNQGDRYETGGVIYEFQLPTQGKWVKL